MDSGRFWNLVLQPATKFGYETDLWTVGRVHQLVQEKLKVVISKNTIWRRLRDAGLTYQKPERQYFEGDDKAREEWVEQQLPKIRETVRWTSFVSAAAKSFVHPYRAIHQCGAPLAARSATKTAVRRCD